VKDTHTVAFHSVLRKVGPMQLRCGKDDLVPKVGKAVLNVHTPGLYVRVLTHTYDPCPTNVSAEHRLWVSVAVDIAFGGAANKNRTGAKLAPVVASRTGLGNGWRAQYCCGFAQRYHCTSHLNVIRRGVQRCGCCSKLEQGGSGSSESSPKESFGQPCGLASPS
jgi:hypothetical protein